MIRVTLGLVRSSIGTWVDHLELALTLPAEQREREVRHTMAAMQSALEILKTAQLGAERQGDQGLQIVTCHGKDGKEHDGHG